MIRVTQLRFLIVFGVFALIGGLWAGLLRAGWPVSSWHPLLPLLHGPLMICAFLGTVIGFERAIAIRKWWTFFGPISTAIGAVLLLLGVFYPWAMLAMIIGSINLCAVFVYVFLLQPTIFHAIIGSGALLWLIGNYYWYSGQPVFQFVLWWLGFLVFTVAGERLELNRLLKFPKHVSAILLLALAVCLAGIVLSAIPSLRETGFRVAGLGLLTTALWLGRFDIARKTIVKEGLTRFIATCLLLGYFWLGVSGILALWYGGVVAGFQYDAMLHAAFVGFVISMIFGHAPIILAAVIGRSVPFTRWYYSHVALLHLSLLLRITGDLLEQVQFYRWGAMLNAVAIVLFILNTAYAVIALGRSTNKARNVFAALLSHFPIFPN